MAQKAKAITAFTAVDIKDKETRPGGCSNVISRRVFPELPNGALISGGV
jgi:hypothetical protein